MFSLESPLQGDSNELTQHTLVNIERKSTEIIPNTIMSAAMRFFRKGIKNEFEIAVVIEPLMFKPLKLPGIL